MKRIMLFLVFFSLAFFSYSQLVLLNHINSSDTYFGVSLKNTSICASAPANNIYIDVPDDSTPRTSNAINESGSTFTNISTVVGITLKDVNGSGNSYYISFCSGGVVQLSGAGTIPIPSGFLPITVVSWYINTGTNTIQVQIS